MFRNASLRIADEDPDYPLQSAFNMCRYPHASAAGKLMLAELADSTFALPRGPLTKVTPHTITDKRQLAGVLADIRAEGEATEINELEQGFARLAVPVRVHAGPVGAALYLSGPTERFTSIRQHGDKARELASRLASFLF